MSRKNNVRSDARSIEGLVQDGHSIREIQRRQGWTFHRSRAAWHAAKATLSKRSRKPKPEPVEEPQAKEKRKPVRISEIPVVQAKLKKGRVHRFLISGAQDDTPVFEPFLKNLEAYAAHIGAQILIGGYTYQLGVFSDHAAETNVYDSRLSPYLRHDRVQLTADLLYLGNSNILPTTANPLNGWTTANRGGHVVIPHSRIALESIPRMQGQPPRYATTTGTVTKPNYTPRAAGQKSIFHHTYGAVVAEIDADGEVFLRHVTADESGCFQDLDVFVENGRCHPGRRVKAVTWGDVHHEQLDPVISLASWGVDLETSTVLSRDNILDGLMPEFQFMHDSLDFRRRNHHDVKNPHQKARILKATNDNVEAEVVAAAGFINAASRDWCLTVMVESNHDAALAKWLASPEGQMDGENAYYWHHLNAMWHRSIRDGDEVNVVEAAMREAGLEDHVHFVPAGGSFVLAGVECGMHGDLGVSGSRGSPNQYRRFGPKTSTGHTHTPKIVEGVFVAGVSAKLDQGYNKGPTTWAHAHIVLYHNGKRALICMAADGRFRAMADRETANFIDTDGDALAA